MKNKITYLYLSNKVKPIKKDFKYKDISIPKDTLNQYISILQTSKNVNGCWLWFE